ncbi:DUF937 domain-containing protein [Leptothermofonsia sp. ETS-13]|uniref:DUF937 domain-containing protein n=1 Tax=Leptothermofonsia sp. ETS-13 TaxID=3035696 RepID=UPI003BA30948
MGLFYEVLSAINNPNQQASIDQLSSLSGSVQQLANQHGIDNNTMQTVLSALGGALSPVLRQQAGSQSLEGMLGQLAGGNFAGTGGNFNPSSLVSLIPPQFQEQIIQTVAQKTGLSAGMLQGLLPALLPIVMNFLNMGKSTSGGQGANPLLNAFLDSDRDGDTDLGDVMKFANRFLNAQYQPA